VAGVAAGAVWGVLVFLLLDNGLTRLGEESRRLAVPSTFLGLAGTAAGAALGIPWLGLGGGLALAAVVTLVLAVAIPGLLTAAGG
jgi:hypothetical protein